MPVRKARSSLFVKPGSCARISGTCMSMHDLDTERSFVLSGDDTRAVEIHTVVSLAADHAAQSAPVSKISILRLIA